MSKIVLKQCSSLEKILAYEPYNKPDYTSDCVLQGQNFSYQLIYTIEPSKWTEGCIADLSLESELKDYIKLYRVEDVPCLVPCYPYNIDDGDYIKTKSCVLPDPLAELKKDEQLLLNVKALYSLWISVDVPKDIKAGVYPIKIKLDAPVEKISAETVFNLEVLEAEQSKSKKLFTRWFYADCIADIHKVEIFSEKHWELIDSYMAMAGESGHNMLLTPFFTPPLDTEVGTERPTVQLVDIYKDGDSYTFGYDRADRWLSMMRKHGFEYVEVPHLFTQWGATSAPKIVAYENGELKKIFGWDTVSYSDEYSSFLAQFLTSLRKYLRDKGLEEKTYFHISDEPNETHLETFEKVSGIAKQYIGNCHLIDALSSTEFYKQGYIKEPVVATNRIEPFVELGVPDLWCYYCCSQGKKVANQFISQPSYRNRILGVQLYKYNIRGFLQWGYNFYYSERSRFLVDPYRDTSSRSTSFIAGDAFMVYPGESGAVPSLRLKVFAEMIQDVAALEELERLSSREEVLELIRTKANMDITFEDYPRNSEFLLDLRREVNRRIAEYAK